ncbi:hypothetical protein JB92DRAFT_2995763 [Gautieria morchelliformis]|nr:hypothetical protein JB92DRAFT_2995763 [Gautieria morchelliformis]
MYLVHNVEQSVHTHTHLCIGILILRTYALYGLRRRILIYLALSWAVLSVTTGLVSIKLGQRADIPTSLIAASRLCPLVRTADPAASSFWASPLLLDTTVFILTIRKTRKYTQDRNSRNIIAAVSFVKAYLRDATMYYVAVLLMHILNCLTTILVSDGIKTLGGR